MNTSPVGIEKIKQREGVRLSMYRDSAGLPTIGVGHLLTKDELSSGKLTALGIDWHEGILDSQATDLLTADLASAEAAILTNVTVPLTQAQFDTLASFVFNIGVTAFAHSTLLKVLNNGEYDSVPSQLRRWVYAGGQRDPILVRRREDEVTQWGMG